MRDNNRRCPVCNSEEEKIIKHIKMIVPEDFIIPSEYNIVSCKECGCVFNDVPLTSAYDEYYGNYKVNTNFTIPSDSDYSLDKLNRESRHIKSANFIENATNISKDASILDVGCSYGATLLELKDKGFTNLFGLDLDKNCISFLEESEISCSRGSIFSEDLHEYDNKFDLIILAHILEHLHEPRTAIDNVKRWLKPNGKIMIECPDLYQYPQTSQFPGFFAEYEHINHFSLISLMNLMHDFNLKMYFSDTIYALIKDFPCLYAMFERSDESAMVCRTMNDEASMIKSLTEPNERGKEVISRIESLENKKIALWGAGQYLYRLLTHTALNKYDICHIVDKSSNKWGKTFFNKQIEKPEILKNFDGTIVICTTTSLDSVLKDIEDIGLTNEVIIP